MNLRELNEKIKIEYDCRELKSDVRYKALNKVIAFLKERYKDATKDVKASLPKEKESLKAAYTEYSGKKINSAESSVINEIYNQLQAEHNKQDIDSL